jgi:CBS domain-containing protein
MLAVHGDRGLAAALYDHAYESAQGQIAFVKALGEHAATPINPFSILGRFRLEDGRSDLKRYGLFPVVVLARTLSIRHDVRGHSTRERLTGLARLGIGPEADFTRLASAHAYVLKYMLLQQSRDLLAGIPVSNRVETAALSGDEQAELRTALKNIQLVPDLVRDMMFG